MHNFKTKTVYIENRPHKIQMMLDKDKKFDTIYFDFAMICNLKERFMKYGYGYQEKPANILFQKIKKEFEKENKNTLLILNHPVAFNVSSGPSSDFLVELCLYIEPDVWDKSKQDEYLPTMIALADKVKEKINIALSCE